MTQYSDTVQGYRDHLKQLAAEHDIEIFECTKCPDDLSFASPERRGVHVPATDSDVRYAVALHEIGHLVAPGGCRGPRTIEYCYAVADCDQLRATEQVAWDWAIVQVLAQGFEWTAGMAAKMADCLDTYDKGVAQRKTMIAEADDFSANVLGPLVEAGKFDEAAELLLQKLFELDRAA